MQVRPTPSHLTPPGGATVVTVAVVPRQTHQKLAFKKGLTHQKPHSKMYSARPKTSNLLSACGLLLFLALRLREYRET